ncbi:MAG: hypothetical protein M1840_006649 [Geoglossum simile]|nr:MAG: hypothetical protein M1840_006649 [Geoglossum simile]
MPYTEPHSQTSTRHSTRVLKPSAYKYVNSESIFQPPYSSQHRKKPFRATPLPAPSRRQRAAIIDIDDVNAGKDAGEDAGVGAGQNEDENEGEDEFEDAGKYANEDEEDVEDEDIIPRIIDNELEDEEEKDKDTMTYLSIWKAIVNSKKILCLKSRLFTVDPTIYSIQCWQREVLEHAALQQLEVIRLQAVTSYEHCRALDECPVELQSQRDIYDATEILRMWHNQRKRSQPDSSIRTGWRTAMQQQIAELPDILQSEMITSNSMLQVADHWTCLNSQCRNKGKTCWINKLRPSVRDNMAEHYSVPGKIFRCWSREITDNLSTVEQPSQQIIILLVNWRERERKKSSQTQQIPRPVEDIASTTTQLLQILIAAQTQQLAQNLYSNGSNSTAVPSLYPPPYTPPIPSSPIRLNSDLSEILSQFFDWLTVKPNAPIKNKLLNEDWSLDALRDERRGGAMTYTIWESYGFKLGTLAKIRSRISEFKQHQRPQSHDSAENNSS